MLKLNCIYLIALAAVIGLVSWDTSDAVPVQVTPKGVQDMRKSHEEPRANDKLWSMPQKKSALEMFKKKTTRAHAHPALSTKFLALVAQGMENENGELPDTGNKLRSEAAGLEDASGGSGSTVEDVGLDARGGDSGSGPSGGSGDGGSGSGGKQSGDKESRDGEGDVSESGEKEPVDGDGESTEGSGEGGVTGSGGNGTDTGHGSPEEITISVPKFEKDDMGNWIYQAWGATYGKIWGDTRFNKDRFTFPRIHVDSNAPNDYYPDGPMSTVCMGSTVYNVPRVVQWLKRNVYLEEHKNRPFWDNLRQQIYIQGKSEECHNATKYAKWRDYQECAMRRNQRLEYMIPKYPLHQIGFKGRPSPVH